MTNELINFETIDRAAWLKLHQKTTPPLTADELDELKSFNDKILLQDVLDIYLPLINLIRIYKKAKEDLSFSKSLFLQKQIKTMPFIIGISGSVSVGKSTTSRLLQLLLSRTFKASRVELVTTDGFLYPNAYLKQHELLQRKGFPESYDMERLLKFLDTIKNGGTASAPVYSHNTYDIVPDQMQTVQAPDFLILEGINVFQTYQNAQLYIRDYFDFSIYVDADSQHIEQWYIERFTQLLQLAEQDPNNYYHQFTKQPYDQVIAFAKSIWETINLPNLENYIAPTKSRADIILHKGQHHQIDRIYLKK